MRWSLESLEGRSPGTILGVCLLFTVAIGALDHLTGPEISSIVFYVPPVSIAGWYGSRNQARILAAAATLTWLVTDYSSGHEYSHAGIRVWNTLVRLLVFLLVAHLFARLRDRLDAERDLAETDSLTGALNGRGLYGRLEQERYRADRFDHPLSLAYLDLDNFKGVNDAFGHVAGDQVLRRIVSLIRANVRKVDLVGRLGGDEFAIAFIEADAQAATEILSKLRGRVSAGLLEAGWPVTFSAGVVTFVGMPPDVREMIRIADELMYSVKRNGKNGFARRTWRPDPEDGRDPRRARRVAAEQLRRRA